jgi:hypothetical protein
LGRHDARDYLGPAGAYHRPRREEVENRMSDFGR